MEEIWKNINGFDIYEVSNFGRIRSKDRYVLRGTHYCNIHGKILKYGIRNDGRTHVSLWKDGKAISKKVHRLVAETFIPNLNNLPEVNHKDETL